MKYSFVRNCMCCHVVFWHILEHFFMKLWATLASFTRLSNCHDKSCPMASTSCSTVAEYSKGYKLNLVMTLHLQETCNISELLQHCSLIIIKRQNGHFPWVWGKAEGYISWGWWGGSTVWWHCYLAVSSGITVNRLIFQDDKTQLNGTVWLASVIQLLYYNIWYQYMHCI